MAKTSVEQFKELETKTQEFFSDLVVIGREKFPGRAGIVEFHLGLLALERIIRETREEEGF